MASGRVVCTTHRWSWFWCWHRKEKKKQEKLIIQQSWWSYADLELCSILDLWWHWDGFCQFLRVISDTSHQNSYSHWPGNCTHGSIYHNDPKMICFWKDFILLQKYLSYIMKYNHKTTYSLGVVNYNKRNNRFNLLKLINRF